MLGLRSMNSRLRRKQSRVHECTHDIRRSICLCEVVEGSGSFSFITEEGYKVRETVGKQVCGQREKVNSLKESGRL